LYEVYIFCKRYNWMIIIHVESLTKGKLYLLFPTVIIIKNVFSIFWKKNRTRLPKPSNLTTSCSATLKMMKIHCDLVLPISPGLKSNHFCSAMISLGRLFKSPFILRKIIEIFFKWSYWTKKVGNCGKNRVVTALCVDHWIGNCS